MKETGWDPICKYRSQGWALLILSRSLWPTARAAQAAAEVAEATQAPRSCLLLAAALLKRQRTGNEGAHSSPTGCRAGHRPGASPGLAFFPFP